MAGGRASSLTSDPMHDPQQEEPSFPGPHILVPLPRCNPLFVRCLKPNHKKVSDSLRPSGELIPLPCAV